MPNFDVNKSSLLTSQKVLSRTMVKQSKRFGSEHIVTDQAEYFLKRALRPQLAEKIKQQVQGTKNLQLVLDKANVSWLKTEKILETGEGWLVSEWLGEGPLATPEEYATAKNLRTLGDFTKIAAQIDKLATDNLPATKNLPIKFGKRTQAQFRVRTLEKFEPLIEKYQWDRQTIEASLDYVDRHAGLLKAGWQHGDLTPWHIYKENRTFVLVDCEHVHNQWPRLYDIANFYSKLVIRFELPNAANQMLVDFQSSRQLNAAELKAFWVLVGLRSTVRLIEHQDQPAIVERAFDLIDSIVNDKPNEY